MSLDYRRKRRTASATLFVTFLLGVAIGFTLCYAVLQVGRPESHGADPLAAADEPAQPTIVHFVSGEDRPNPASEPDTPVPQPPAAQAPTEQEPAPPEPPPAPVWPARHLFIGIPGTTLDPATTELLRAFRPGGIVLGAQNVTDAGQTRALVEAILNAVPWTSGQLAPPLIVAAQRGGDENPLRLDEAPSPREAGGLADAQAIRNLAQRTAQLCRERGVDMLLAPPLDVYVPGAAPAECEPRTFAADTARVISASLEYLAGLEAGGVVPCVVHYPGAGGATPDDAGLLVVKETEIEKLEAQILPFDAAGQHNVPAVLVGHIAVPALEGADTLVPASCSRKLVRMLLRDRRRFAGAIIADDVSRPGAAGGRAPEEAAVQALAAGCDAVIVLDAPPERLNAICAAVAESAAAGVLQEQELQASRDRIDVVRAHAGRLSAAKPEEVLPPPGTEPVKHRIKEGETLSSIAAQYGVSVDDLKRWNQVDDPSHIKFGQELTVHVPPKPAEAVPEPPSPAPDETPAPETAETTPAEPATEAAPEAVPEPEPPGEPPGAHPPSEAAPVPDSAAGSSVPEAPSEAAEPEPPGEPPGAHPPSEAAPVPDSAAGSSVPEAPPEAAEPEPPATTEAPAEQAQESDPPPNSQRRVYRVVPGDTLAKIAEQYGVTPEEIARWNKLEGKDPLPGLLLDVYLPMAEDTAETAFEEYRVGPGDTLHSIAMRYGVTVPDLLRHNKIPNPDILVEGQRIKIPKSR